MHSHGGYLGLAVPIYGLTTGPFPIPALLVLFGLRSEAWLYQQWAVGPWSLQYPRTRGIQEIFLYKILQAPPYKVGRLMNEDAATDCMLK